MPSRMIDLANQQAAALDAQDAATLNRLIQAYGRIYQRLQSSIELLAQVAGDGEMSRAEAAKDARLRSLLADVARELRQFQGFTAGVLDEAAQASIDKALKDSVALMGAGASDAGIAVRFDRLPKAAVEKLLAFLDPQGPLFKRLEMLAPTTAQRISDTFLEGVALGHNPKKIAREITDTLGMGLTDSLRMTRTAQLYAYREAARANYVANSDVVQGWIWYAHLDDATCMSCVAMHGTVHGLDESLNDHHNGRCAALPLVVGADNPVEEDGSQWFDGLSAEQQQAMMGKGRYEAFKAGKFEFGDLSGQRDDAVYGTMRVEASLKELA